MSKNNTVKLSDILAQLSETREKIAQDELTPEEVAAMQAGNAGGMAPEAVPAEAPVVGAAPQVVPEQVPMQVRVQAPVAAADPVETAAEEVAQAVAAKNDAVATLKDIAMQAAEAEQGAIAKEAAEFGRVFAGTVMEELQTADMAQTHGASAYQNTMSKLAEDDLAMTTEQIFAEAYEMTKVAMDDFEALAHEATEFDGMLNKVAEEAYDMTVDLVGKSSYLDDEANLYNALDKVASEAYDLTMGYL